MRLQTISGKEIRKRKFETILAKILVKVKRVNRYEFQILTNISPYILSKSNVKY